MGWPPAGHFPTGQLGGLGGARGGTPRRLSRGGLRRDGCIEPRVPARPLPARTRLSVARGLGFGSRVALGAQGGFSGVPPEGPHRGPRRPRGAVFWEDEAFSRGPLGGGQTAGAKPFVFAEGGAAQRHGTDDAEQ
eukprot:9215649-Pyramimonas_sp.AAC.2